MTVSTLNRLFLRAMFVLGLLFPLGRRVLHAANPEPGNIPNASVFRVVSMVPAANSTGVLTGATIRVTCSGVVNSNTLNAANWKVRGQQVGFYPGTYRRVLTNVIEFVPSYGFLKGESLQVNLSTSVLSTTGANLLPFAAHLRTSLTPCGGLPRFQLRQQLRTSSVNGVVLGDIDGDRDLDAVFSVPNGPNQIWLNRGGVLENSNVGLGNGDSRGLRLGDLNNDGKLDIAVANVNGQPSEIWLNNGVGAFPVSTSFGSSFSRDLDLGDLDGDGDLDIFVANYGQPNRVFRNDGIGRFVDSGQWIGGSQMSQAVALGDLDGDGDLDAFEANGNDQEDRVWLNNAGTFTDSGQRLGASRSASVALGDLDGDGDLDAAVGNSGGQSDRIWINSSNATFSPGPNLPRKSSAGAVALGDLEGDGDLDLFVANSDTNEAIWLNNGSAQFSRFEFDAAGINSSGLALGDLDGDGRLEIVTAQSSGNSRVYEMDCLNAVSLFPSADPANPITSDAIAFHVDVVNAGLQALTNITVTASFDRNVSLLEAERGTLISSQVARWTRATLAPSGSIRYTVLARITLGRAGSIQENLALTGFVASLPVVASTNFLVTIADTDRDGTPDYLDDDSDGDKLPDSWELAFGLDPQSAVGADGYSGDPDGDGVENIIELKRGSSPTIAEPTAMPWTRVYEAQIGQQFVTGAYLGGFYESAQFNLEDLDNDADLDFIIDQYYSPIAEENRATLDGLPIYYNIQNATTPVWSNPEALSLPMISQSRDWVDIDNDGDLDLFVAESSTLHFYQNVGKPQTPVWAHPVTNYAGLTWPLLFGAENVRFVDIDDDQDYDMVVEVSTGSGRRADLYRNTGSPRIAQWATPEANVFGQTVSGLEFVDIHDDGDYDAYSKNGAFDIAFFKNQGSPHTANWAAPVMLNMGIELDPSAGLTFSDIDSDGDFDLVTSERFRGPVLFINSSGAPAPPIPRFEPARRHFLGFDFGQETYPTACDIDSDGDLDLAIGSLSDVFLLRNIGSPSTPVWSEQIDIILDDVSATIRRAPEFGDLDGDGDLDALAVPGTSMAPSLYYYANTGTLTHAAFANRTLLTNVVNQGGGTWIDTVMLALHDWDSDGDLDLHVGISGDATNTTATRHTVRYMQNTGTRQSPVFIDRGSVAGEFLTGASVKPTGVRILDLDGNGQMNLLMTVPGTDGSAYRYFENRSTSNIPAWVEIADLSEIDDILDPIGNWSPVFADIDNDGDDDFIGGGREGGLVFLRNDSPHLAIRPVNVTVATGEPVAFSASNTVGSVLWRFLENRTGATLQVGTGAYTAGSTSGVDVVEGADSTGLRGRAFVNVLDAQSVSAIGKAIIIAGGKAPDDPVWLATDQVARKAYNTLRLKGFLRENIKYLSFVPGVDVDGNGLNDDMDGPSTLAEATTAFTTFAANADQLFVYLVNHGSSSGVGLGAMRLNATELLSASQVDTWLDALQTPGGTPTALVLDFCYSGSFIDEVTSPTGSNRVVVASCAANQLTYFIANGYVSFSESFFGGLLQNMTVGQAFVRAMGAMSLYQSAQLDDNGDGQFNKLDGALAKWVTVGASFVQGLDAPQIGRINSNQTLDGDETVHLTAEQVSSVYPVTRVWCVIVPPSHAPDSNSGDPVTDLPEVDLPFNFLKGVYEADFTGFSDPGTYSVIFFAQDIWGSVSYPKQSFITQGGFEERALLVLGYSSDPTNRTAILETGKTVYQILRNRHFSSTNIIALAQNQPIELDDTTGNDVDALATVAAIANAITNTASGADRLLVYLVGDASNQTFRVSSTQNLTVTNLAQYVDRYQATGGTAYVVMDFWGAGSFVPALRSPPGRERVVVASTREGRPNLDESDGLLSFSQLFMSEIASGKSIGDAAHTARKVVRRASGRLRQRPEIDDDGDGISNEKNVDGVLAENLYIGAAFLTGDDVPSIGNAGPSGIVATNTVMVWAENVLDVDGISNVVCIVTPPTYDGTGDADAITLPLNPGNGRYEAVITGFHEEGLYSLTFYAEDTRGNVSAAVQRQVTRTDDPYSVPDAFENDNIRSRASEYQGAQYHTFHQSNDVDWVRIYMLSNFVYDIETLHHGTNIDTVIDVYYQRPDGSITNIDHVDEFGFDEGELTGLDFPRNGYYLLRVSAFLENGFRPDAYTLVVDVPAGGGSFIVMAVDAITAQALPVGTAAVVDGGSGQPFNGSSSIALNLSAGPHAIAVNTAAGYLPVQSTVLPDQVSNPNNEVFGNPRAVLSEDVSIGASGFATFAYYPYVRIHGRVRDAWTGAWVRDAGLSWQARSGALSGTTFDRYPIAATYALPWASQSDGALPTNLFLIAGLTYDLQLSHAEFLNRSLLSVNASVAPGTALQLGDLLLTPVDGDSNRIADVWEFTHFGTNANPLADRDHDGLNEKNEYRLGFDPDDANSVLSSVIERLGNQPMTLSWPVAPGRVYQVRAGQTLATTNWSLVHGPVTAAAGQVNMIWSDTSPSPPSNRFYRIDALLP